jgi:2-polyprenyl-6-methoxyphenol hydroxylase-like FAD-dependent oxidoreductase
MTMMRRVLVHPTSSLILLIITTCFYVETCHGLSTPKPVKRIAIIGSGISGLSVAQALTNNPSRKADCFDVVDIFDARASLDTTAGAGIQLNGGLSVLGKINPALQEAVYEAGLSQVRVRSRCKPWFGDKKFDTLLELDLKKTVMSAGGDTAASLLSSDDQRLWWTSIMRGALQQVLLETLPRDVSVQFSKKLTSINPVSENSGVYCKFADGSETGPYDLVIGCEGINSFVKNYVDTNGRPKPDDASSAKSAIYSGLRIRYAVSDGDPTKPFEETATLTQFFGNGAYALHGVYGAGAGKPNTRCAFIIYLDENYIGPFKKKEKPRTDSSIRVGENADWSQDKRKTVDVAREDMFECVKFPVAQMTTWARPLYNPIVFLNLVVTITIPSVSGVETFAAVTLMLSFVAMRPTLCHLSSDKAPTKLFKMHTV